MIFAINFIPETLNMKKLFVVIFGIFIVTLSCEKDRINENFRDDPSILTINGKWKVVSYEDFEKGSIIVKNDVDSWNGMDVILTFADSTFYGQNTTNIISGKYSLAGRYIDIISYGSTKIAQPAWGNMFSDIVYSVRSFEINEHQLRFFYNDSEKSVTLTRD
jgi:heat shock protein HslJ